MSAEYRRVPYTPNVIIGHAPTGYLLAHVARGSARISSVKPQRIVFAAVVGSLLPDADMFWFYFVHDRQYLHHSYWTHIPSFWLGVGLLGAAGGLAARRQEFLLLWGVFLGGILSHLVLDSVAGGIRWLAPLSPHEFRMVEVPARHSWWVLNFVLHWSFCLELTLLLAACLVYRRRTAAAFRGEEAAVKTRDRE